MPISGILLWLRRDRCSRIHLGILTCATAIQVHALLVTDSAARNHWPLGASFELLVRIVAGQVYLGTILGANRLASHTGIGFIAWVAVIGSSLVAYCFWKARSEWKLFLLFSSLILVASLKSPVTSSLPAGLTVWRLIAEVPGIRYWFFPTLAFAWISVWYAFGERPGRLPKAIGAALLFMMMVGVIRDWRHPAYRDFDFASYSNTFEASTPGSVLTFPVNPNGWDVRLVKP
jgi:hypothetical protein